MGFLARVVRFLFWLLILSWAVKLLGRALAGTGAPAANEEEGGGRTGDSANRGKRLVKDPVCGMHMAEELALPATVNGEAHFFCSEDCRDKFANSVLKRAANA